MVTGERLAARKRARLRVKATLCERRTTDLHPPTEDLTPDMRARK